MAVFKPDLTRAILLEANDLADRMEADGHADLLPAFATPVPVAVISGMLGVPQTMNAQLLDWHTAWSPCICMAARARWK